MTFGYDALGKVYDRLNKDVDYSEIADFIEDCYARFQNPKPEKILDLGCGTGSLTVELASRGYKTTALDISPEMLSSACQTAMERGLSDILFIEGDMRDFEFLGTVDSVVCTMDGVNHITKKDDLIKCFKNVRAYLEKDGLFIFDVNSPYKFKHIYADNVYVLEDDGVMCVWQNVPSARGDLCSFYLTVFEEQSDGRYIRSDGVHKERRYSLNILKKALSDTGFAVMGIYGGLHFEDIADDTERYQIVAKAV